MQKQCIAGVLLAIGSVLAHAQATPVGLWKTIDDSTKKERSLIRITDTGGVLNGRIEKSLDPDAKPGSVCEKCTDERKGQPMLGLALVRNVRQNAGDPAVWDGGDITDPDNGKVYKVRLKPIDDGKKLEVRGYLGPFYRTQTWLRAE